MTPLGSLRRTLTEGRPTRGYLVTMPSVQLVQALTRTGVDWLMLDMGGGSPDRHAAGGRGRGARGALFARGPRGAGDIGRVSRFIVLGSDAGLIAGAAQRMVQAIRA